MGYYVKARDWPTEPAEKTLSTEEIFQALDGLEDYVGPARASLAVTGEEGLRRLAEKRPAEKT